MHGVLGMAAGVMMMVCLGLAASARAGRPLELSDAGTVEPGHAEVEAGVAWGRDSESDGWEGGVGLTLGVVKNLEVGIAGGYQW